ncbi:MULTISPECIES: hypothetical protein [Capnocytophaga]|uniref:hypothetical protein n=1 Tax=Capnocytophaga TaxID=1016 RepID=UPI001AC3BC4D|nr:MULTISPECIES: hypothetical protein [Capnocytophaga]GIM53078.1 hypothetical protein CAPN004_21080 [Capnocytophaga cynodegmi]GIM56595.1 hypothetical protein CAPN006_09890 [Capnocytophaga canimorsus]
MNTLVLIANILVFLAFLIHTFIGDKELKVNQPDNQDDPNFIKQEKWTMARCGWHWVSVDLLLASVILALVNFSDFLSDERLVLQLLSLYFFVYAIAWILTIFISKSFPKNYLKLGQWLLLFIIALLLFFSIY